MRGFFLSASCSDKFETVAPRCFLVSFESKAVLKFCTMFLRWNVIALFGSSSTNV